MDDNKKLHEELQKCKIDSELQSDFIATIIHQLRIPLSGSKWTFESFLDGDFGSLVPEQKQIIEQGLEKNIQMAELLEQLSVAYKNQTWELPYEFKDVDIEILIKKVANEFAEEAEAKNIQILFTDTQEKTPLIKADPQKISIVFRNLIENAIKYNDPGGKVSISYESQNDNVLIKIEDTGIGIQEAEKETLFKKYFRSIKAATHSPEGSGLGLYIAKNIVSKHSGEITFHPSLSKGATFVVKLPRNIPK